MNTISCEILNIKVSLQLSLLCKEVVVLNMNY